MTPTLASRLRRLGGRVRRRLRVDWADDSGQVGGVEVLPFSLLIFVAGALIVANAWAVIDIKLAVNAATREGARAFVEASDAAAGGAEADRVAREAITGHGRRAELLVLDPPDYAGGSFRRCNPVTIHASYPVPALTVPFIGSYGEGFKVTSSHTELIDPYRSGPTSDGGC